jgi:hypothetical protein
MAVAEMAAAKGDGKATVELAQRAIAVDPKYCVVRRSLVLEFLHRKAFLKNSPTGVAHVG